MVTDVVNNIPVLSESPPVITPMMCFIHQTTQPDLENVCFELVAEFADAAEKYFVILLWCMQDAHVVRSSTPFFPVIATD